MPTDKFYTFRQAAAMKLSPGHIIICLLVINVQNFKIIPE